MPRRKARQGALTKALRDAARHRNEPSDVFRFVTMLFPAETFTLDFDS